MFAALARSIFGTHNDRTLKAYGRQVVQINALEPAIQAMTDAELTAQTAKFRQLLQDGKTLNDIMPEAFATAREAAFRALGQRPFDVQLLGAMALNDGYIPEMRTGEGKTLTATLAVYLNAIAGKGVHVVTVNDYLAQRDALWMKPIYSLLGLTVGWIISNISDEERRAAYNADITYGTNNEFGFDYLRDNMKFRLAEMVQRPFNYAIVDEVDSILIDEARTPLIISGMAQDSADAYRSINRVIPELNEEDYQVDEKHKTVILSDIGNEHAEQVLQDMGILKEGGLYDAQNIQLVHHINQALRAHKLFTRDVDYIVKDDAVVIIDEFTGRMMEGRRYSEGLHQALEAKEGVKIQNENQTLASITFQNYFRMYPKLAGMTGTAVTEKDEFDNIYNLRTLVIPTNLPQIRIDHHDEIYRTAAEKYDAIVTQIRECQERQQPVLVGTSSIEKSEILARLLTKKNITHQVLNARYHEQEAYIIAQAGKPGAVTIATNMAGRGTDIKLGGNVDMRLDQEIPIDADPSIRDRLTAQIRAEVAEACEVVKKAGGLFVVGSERHESRRIDNQLRGRSGRQGDPGASKFFISLEDDLMRIFGSQKMDTFLQRMGLQPGQPLVHPLLNGAIEGAQKKVEQQHFEARKHLLKFDNVMNDQRKVIYEQRRDIMNSNDVSEMVTEMRLECIDSIISLAIPSGSYPEQWDLSLLKNDSARLLGLNIPAEDWAKEEGIDAEIVTERISALSQGLIDAKEKAVSADMMRQLEKAFLLQLLDQAWKEHLLHLDYLRQGIMLRAFGQKDPLNEYKAEAFAMFQDMLVILRERVTSAISLIELQPEEPLHMPEPKQPEKIITSRGSDLSAQKDNVIPGTFTKVEFDQADPATWARTPRNAACPCGSGKKYKYCHGQSN
jgi:preprotein translocase subunit SecA